MPKKHRRQISRNYPKKSLTLKQLSSFELWKICLISRNIKSETMPDNPKKIKTYKNISFNKLPLCTISNLEAPWKDNLITQQTMDF